MSTPTKVTVALNAIGQVAAASLPTTASEVTSGMVADLGQTLVEVELTGPITDMAADKLLAHFAEHASVKAASMKLSATASSSQEITSGSL